MEFNYQDKGNYFRGLLILIGKDNVIGNEERQKILEIADRLGFDAKFCNNAVSEFLENKYISNQPPKFSSSILANLDFSSAFSFFSWSICDFKP